MQRFLRNYLYSYFLRWKYQSSDQLNGAPYSGQIGVVYSGAGSVQDLSSLRDESAKIIK